MKWLLSCTCILLASVSSAQVNMESWWLNTTNNTYSGALTDVEEIWYTNNFVFIVSSGIPSYFSTYAGVSLFQPTDQDYVFKIDRNPAEETGTKQSMFTGTIGVGLDGSAFFHWGDGKSWDGSSFSISGDDVWHSLAWEYEGLDMDASNGHSTATNIYHHHVANFALFTYNDSTVHSPLIGFALDGYPIYGAYGYSSPYDASSSITRMKSSYQERNISDRTTLPDGTVLSAADYGPTINSNYPLGSCEEDFEYVNGSGNLDEYNGRWCITPEYPCGTYAYFVTLDNNLEPDFPYIMGHEFFGEVSSSIGPGLTSANIPGPAVEYTGTSLCSTSILGTVTQPTCGGNDGSVVLNVSGFGTSPCYSWSNGGSSANESNLSGGSYTVYVGGDGCTDSATFTLTTTGSGGATSNITLTDPSCGSADGEILFGMPTGTGPFMFSVDSGATFQSNPAFQLLAPGLYSTVLQDGSGCWTVQSVSLNSSGGPTISNVNSDDVQCFGQSNGAISISATGGTPPYQYSVDNGVTFQSSASFNGLSTGNYTIIVQDDNGCSTISNASLSEPTPIAISGISTDEVSGSDGSIDVTTSGGTPPYSYSWDNGASFEDISSLASGTYTVTVTDANNCTAMMTFSVGTQVGVREISAVLSSIYPNPAQNQIFVKSSQTVASIRILDITGKVVLTSFDESQINLGSIQAGAYFVQVVFYGDQIETHRLIKQ